MTDDERRQLEALRTSLLREYSGVLEPGVVDARFEAAVAGFADARVRTFVPLLAQRRVREELRVRVSS